MKKEKASIVFVNQSSGYLMIDIINEHADLYDDIILLTGFLNPRNIPLHPKVKVVKLMTYNRTSTLKRLFTWGMFFLQTLFLLLFKYRRHSLYLVSNPPINILLGYWLKRPLAFLVYDVYPHAFVAYGILKESSWIYKRFHNINQKVFGRAKRVITLSEGMKRLISNERSILDKVDVVPVWTDNKFFKTIEKKDNLFIQKYNLEDKFLVSYSGNIGKTHPVEVILELAKACQNIPEIQFLIIGEGEKKSKIETLKNEMNLENVHILPFQPTELFPHSLAATDIGVVTLDAQAGHLSVPSKTFNLMSVKKAILAIASEDAELAQLIKKYEIGGSFEQHQIEAMVNFVTKVMEDSIYYKRLSTNSFQCSHYFTPQNAKRMILEP